MFPELMAEPVTEQLDGDVMAEQELSAEPRFRGRATIRDIADLAGVSIATVSRVLNDRPDVAPGTRENVLQVVREQGFKRAARAHQGAPLQPPAKERTGSIGLTLPLVNDAYFGPMLFGASEALYEADMRIVMCPTLHEHDREVSLIERLMRGGSTDGAILVLPEERADELLSLRKQGYPFVVVDPREPPPDGIPCVSAMHAAGAKQATEHLLELGHRRIGAIAGTPGWYATEERLHGFRAALAARGSCSSRSWSCTPTGARRAGSRRRSSCSRFPSRRPRSSRSTTTSRSASSTRRGGAG